MELTGSQLVDNIYIAEIYTGFPDQIVSLIALTEKDVYLKAFGINLLALNIGEDYHFRIKYLIIFKYDEISQTIHVYDVRVVSIFPYF